MSDPRFALPTLEESTQLRQAESIVHGNLLQMECEELVKEITVNYDHLPTFEKALFTLREILLNTPDQHVRAAVPGANNDDTSAAASSAASGNASSAAGGAADGNGATPATTLRVPPGTSLRRWTTDLSERRSQSTELYFHSPSNIELMGSYLLRTIARPKCSVDLAVTMPAECFRPKDVLDYRYHDKRLLYLECLRLHVLNSCLELRRVVEEEEEDEEEEETIKFDFSDITVVGFADAHDVLSKPILLVRPKILQPLEEEEEEEEEEENNEDGRKRKKKKMKMKKKKKIKKKKFKMRKIEKEFTIRIHLCAPSNVFDPAKLSSTSGNLRIHRSSTNDQRLPTPR